MALSFCSNWESSLQQLNSEMLSYNNTSLHNQQQQQLDETLYSFNNNNSGFEFSDTSIDQYLAPDEFFYTDALISLSPEIFPLEDFEYSKSYQLPLPKRQKHYHYDPNFTPNFFYGHIPNPPFVPEIPALVPEFQAPAVTPKTESVMKKQDNGTSLSVQSIAARERRRKITEKTQELGKLIPGGHRMNTAEMFQAASKYVKFLQAQAKLLQLMEPKQQEMKEPFHAQDQLQNLLASPIIQEKLYSEEKCLVPKELVETLANDPGIKSKPMVVEGIDQLLRTNGHS